MIYCLRRPWPRRGGVRRLVIEPHDLLRRLAALTPAPYAHLVRYHGVFANRSKARWRLPSPPSSEVAKIAADAAGSAPGARPPGACRRFPWAQLLRRASSVDVLRCPRCAKPMVVLAVISDPPAVARILSHLGLVAEPPLIAPAAQRDGDAVGLGEPFLDLDEPVGEVFEELEEPPGELSSSDAPWGDDDEVPPQRRVAPRSSASSLPRCTTRGRSCWAAGSFGMSAGLTHASWRRRESPQAGTMPASHGHGRAPWPRGSW